MSNPSRAPFSQSNIYTQVADAVCAAGTCKAAAAAQEGGADFRRIAGMRFKHLECVCVYS